LQQEQASFSINESIAKSSKPRSVFVL
jgi:hypothetical protein